MLNRRTFLASAGASALMLHPALAALPVADVVPTRNPALELIAEAVRDFLSRIAAEGIEHCRDELWRSQYAEWSQVENIEAKILDTMHGIYRNRLFTELKLEHGSLMQNGRMPLKAVYMFLEYVPALHDHTCRELFQAFASFAPAHLL